VIPYVSSSRDMISLELFQLKLLPMKENNTLFKARLG